MEKMLLRDPEIVLTKEVLADALGDVYPVFDSFMNTVESEGLTSEWRYYNDGKAWLGKVVHKKKTVCWLSVWEGYFQLSFFFLERHLEAIDALDISEAVKENFLREKPIGKSLPMLFRIRSAEQLPDVFKVITFKKIAK